MKEEEAPDLQQRSENPSVQFRAYVYVFFLSPLPKTVSLWLALQSIPNWHTYTCLNGIFPVKEVRA